MYYQGSRVMGRRRGLFFAIVSAALVVAFFPYFSSAATPSCDYFSDDFSGGSANQWTSDDSSNWFFQNGWLNVGPLGVNTMTYAGTAFSPPAYFVLDVDIPGATPGSFPLESPAFGIYPFTTKSGVSVSVEGRSLDGVGAIVWTDGTASFMGWDLAAGKYYVYGAAPLPQTLTSVGVAYSATEITLRLNKQNASLKVTGTFPLSVLPDTLWLFAEGLGTQVAFDNVCAGPLSTPPAKHSLTVNKTGAGSGTITSSPAGVNCGGSCAASYTKGSTVTLTASADAGSSFSGWSGGGCSGTGSCTLSLNADTVVTAAFTTSAAALPAPKNLRYTLNGAILTINWDAVAGATGYIGGVGQQSGKYDGFADLGNITSFGPVDAAGVPAGTYYIVMKAYDGTQESGLSNEIAITLGGGSEFQYGTPKTYNISGTTDTSINDSVTGNTFRFPQGGKGILIVTPITSVPEDGPVSGSGYKVEFSGTDSLQILIPHNADEIPLLWFWGDPGVSIYESNGPAETWIPVLSQDNTGNPAVFDLWLSGSSANSSAMSLRPAVVTKSPEMKIWQAKLDKKDWRFSQMQKLIDLASLDIQKVVNLLPEKVQQRAVPEINGRLKVKVSGFYSGIAKISFYNPFSITGVSVDPFFAFVVSDSLYGDIATVSTVAHEVGHYMSHVLLGDLGMSSLRDQVVNPHDIGDAHAGRPMLDEYSQFTDYCINKTVRGGEIRDIWSMVGGKGSPNTQDWPSKEGYATGLLALMTTDNAKLISSRSGEDEYIPLVGATLTDLWGILANGPLTVDELYTNIVSYLSTRADKLPPLLERTGWSYMGDGQIVDSQKKGMPFAMVQAVAKVPSEGANKEYLAPLNPVKADKDGNFTLDRIFPGNNSIRVWSSEGATRFMDFPIKVIPVKPTNEKLALGQFVLGPAIASVSPKKAGWNNLLTIKGSGFGTSKDTRKVYINGSAVPDKYVTWTSDTEVQTWIVVSNYTAKTGKIVVEVNGVISNEIVIDIVTAHFSCKGTCKAVSGSQTLTESSVICTAAGLTPPINWEIKNAPFTATATGSEFAFKFTSSKDQRIDFSIWTTDAENVKSDSDWGASCSSSLVLTFY